MRLLIINSNWHPISYRFSFWTSTGSGKFTLFFAQSEWLQLIIVNLQQLLAWCSSAAWSPVGWLSECRPIWYIEAALWCVTMRLRPVHLAWLIITAYGFLIKQRVGPIHKVWESAQPIAATITVRGHSKKCHAWRGRGSDGVWQSVTGAGGVLHCVMSRLWNFFNL